MKSQDKGEFFTFIKKCKELSLYNTKNTAEYGDRLITLLNEAGIYVENKDYNEN